MAPTSPPAGAPRWYFGWNIVAAATVLTLLTVGMRMGIGPFFLPMAQDLGFSRSLLSAMIAVGMLLYGLGLPLAGHLAAVRGTRFVLLLGTAVTVASLAWTVVTRGPISFFLAFGVCASLGLAFTSQVALTPVLSRWFVRRRGTALFFLSTGSMAGIAVLTPVFAYAIAHVGWRATMLGFAVVFLVVAVPTILLVIRDEAPPGADRVPGQERAAASKASLQPLAGIVSAAGAIRTPVFWQICFGLFACGYSMNLLGTHGMPMLMDHGFDGPTSASGIGLIGAVAIVGSLVLGRISDAVPRRNVLAAIYLVRGIGFLCLVAVTSPWALYATSVIGGLVWAGSIAASSAILADVYGVRLVGLLYGLAYVAHQVGGMISSWTGGWAYEHLGTHWPAFGSAALFLVAAAVVSMRLPAYGTGSPQTRAVAGA